MLTLIEELGAWLRLRGLEAAFGRADGLRARQRRSGLMFREAGDAEPERGVQILHAEDDQLVAAMVGEILRSQGWGVTTLDDGLSALREIEGATHYDLILVDKQLPGVDGLELVRRARELPHRQQVPVVMLSAEDSGREARSAGASAFLRKPEDVHALVETVARLLGRKPKQG
ncbi:MAG TPA: response regulator [Pyrinomonadaceae bacterium]